MDLLTGVESLSVGELSRSLGVSEATVRRDLSSMDGRGLLHRYHGGASLTSPSASEQLFSDKENLLGDEKRRIAQAALSLIDE